MWRLALLSVATRGCWTDAATVAAALPQSFSLSLHSVGVTNSRQFISDCQSPDRCWIAFFYFASLDSTEFPVTSQFHSPPSTDHVCVLFSYRKSLALRHFTIVPLMYLYFIDLQALRSCCYSKFFILWLRLFCISLFPRKPTEPQAARPGHLPVSDRFSHHPNANISLQPLGDR